MPTTSSDDVTTTPAFAQLALKDSSSHKALPSPPTTLLPLGHGPCYRCGSTTYPFFLSTAFESASTTSQTHSSLSSSTNKEWCSVCHLQDRIYMEELSALGGTMTADEVMEYQLQVNYGAVPTRKQMVQMKKEVMFKTMYNQTAPSQQTTPSQQQAGYQPSYHMNPAQQAMGGQKQYHSPYPPVPQPQPKIAAQQASVAPQQQQRKILPAKSRRGSSKNGNSPCPLYHHPILVDQQPRTPLPAAAPSSSKTSAKQGRTPLPAAPPSLTTPSAKSAPKFTNGLIFTTPSSISNPPAKRQRKQSQKALPSQRASNKSASNPTEQKPLPPPPMRPGGPCHICHVTKSTSWRGSSSSTKRKPGEEDGERVTVMWWYACWKHHQAEMKGKGEVKDSSHSPPKRKEWSPIKDREGLREMGEY